MPFRSKEADGILLKNLRQQPYEATRYYDGRNQLQASVIILIARLHVHVYMCCTCCVHD